MESPSHFTFAARPVRLRQGGARGESTAPPPIVNSFSILGPVSLGFLLRLWISAPWWSDSQVGEVITPL